MTHQPPPAAYRIAAARRQRRALEGLVGSGELEEFVPRILELASAGGSLHGVPRNIDVRLLHYRADLVRTPPATRDGRTPDAAVCRQSRCEMKRRDFLILPTDARLKRVQDGASDTALETLYFQYGRYLLMASSRPGVSGAHKLRPPRGQRVSSVSADGKSLKFSSGADGVVRLRLTAGVRYRVRFD